MTADVSGSWFGSPTEPSADRNDDASPSSASSAKPRRVRVTGDLPPHRLEPLDPGLKADLAAWRHEREANPPQLDLWSDLKRRLDES